MSDPILETEASPDHPEVSEAYQALLARVGRKSAKIPADVLVRHVLGCVPDPEWPVRLEAMDALLRRLESARRDGLRIDAGPGEGRLLGHYATRRRGSSARPYSTLVAGVDPIEASCDCPDFLRNSLGICKHALSVLEHLHAKPGRLKRAREEQSQAGPRTGLRWDPVRPLTGAGDWLERVSWSDPPGADGRRSERVTRALAGFRRGGEGVLVPRKTYRDDPTHRLDFVEDLLRILPARPAGVGHDPALRALLSGERERLRRAAKLAMDPAEIRPAIKGLKRTLYPYQREGVTRFLSAGRLLLADDMGLGKTAQAIACCEILGRAGRVRRGLLIVPASLKPQWAREWAFFSDLPVHVVEGTPAERRELYGSRRSGFLIINYEQLIRDLEMIRQWGPDLVVLDEAQRIKNWATKTALSVKGLAPPYRLVLTGTPMENRIDELASIVEWVDDMALEPKWRLAPLHAVRSDGRHEITGVRHLGTIRDRLRHCLVRRVRQDVLDQLPPRTDVRVPIEMTPPQQEEHDALIQPIAQLVQISKVRPLTQAQFLRLMSLLTTQRIISNGLAQLRFEEVWPAIRACPPEESVIQGLSSPKLLELRQLVRQLALEQGRKIVVFSQWRRMLALAHWAVGDLLGEERLRAGFFTGAEGQKRRTQNIVEFHDDPAYRLLFASDAGGVGLNLQRAANCVINLELPWNPAVLEQRIGRIYRLGQRQPIDVYNLVSEQGIESRISGLVGSKQAFFKGLFDGGSDAVQFEQSGSFLSRVEKIYDPSELAPSSSGGGRDDSDGPLDVADEDILDVEAADPFEPLLEAADESTDSAPVPSQAAPSLNGSSEPQALHPEVAPPEAGPPPSSDEVRRLFGQLQIRRAEGGKVLIEAPPEAANTLGALFEGMAALLRAASQPGVEEPRLP
jgi:superfamily II DNA or RNA helicase